MGWIDRLAAAVKQHTGWNGLVRRQKVALTAFRRPAKLPPRNGTGGRAVEGARLESV
jgi:hypothetical protein